MGASPSMIDDFDHTIQHFKVNQPVRVTKYLTAPIENCKIKDVAPTIGGWYYIVEAPSGDTRVLQANQLEAI